MDRNQPLLLVTDFHRCLCTWIIIIIISSVFSQPSGEDETGQRIVNKTKHKSI
ncbi:hypothetical protein HanPSC8_Chr13g0544991 [Helianthus annuus]|nr:hypothetical protein HanPSC8_Chr13g0544991 [Helianthus annuus]